MLESPDDETRRYPLFVGEPADVLASECAIGYESPPSRLGHQELRRPIVRPGLHIIPAAIGPVNENVLFTVKEDMRGLVEQAEPEVGRPSCGVR